MCKIKVFPIFLISLICIISLYGEDKKFNIYTDKNSGDNHFIPSGWMGDYGDLKIFDQSQEEPFSGTTCIKINYSAKKAQGQGWAGIYWQSSQNNWGQIDTGLNLSEFNKLVFHAKGKNGGEVIALVKVGGILRDAAGNPLAFADTTDVVYGPIRLTNQWQEYSVNLSGKDLSYINGGLALVFNADYAAQQEEIIYLDEIYYTSVSDLKKAEARMVFPFYVYADAASLDNHYVPSGWMPATAARDLRLDISWKDYVLSGDSCLRIEYKNKSGTRWAGMCWQNPANNWGSIPNVGYNLQGVVKLTFWARGDKGGEIINEFKIGGISSGEYIDSDSAGIGPVQLTKEWKQYEIDLRGRDLSYIIGGFGWATNIDVNDPEGIVFYLDEIKYEIE